MKLYDSQICTDIPIRTSTMRTSSMKAPYPIYSDYSPIKKPVRDIKDIMTKLKNKRSITNQTY